MRREWVLLLLIGSLVVLGAVAVGAQEAALDEDINAYKGAFTFGQYLLTSVVWSGIYLALTAAALIVSLSYLRLFSGQVDSDLLLWVGLTWIGGLAANAVGYRVAGHYFSDITLLQPHLLAIVVALPLTFGWALLLATRNFADLPLGFAWRVALVVALVIAPYFGPTWKFPGMERKTPPATQAVWYGAQEISRIPVDMGARIG